MEYKAGRETWNLSGIYKIVSLINGKKYIGSAVNFRKRFRLHFQRLQKGIHNSPILQNTYNKYGENNLTFKIIEIVSDQSKLIEKEQFYLDSQNPEFNICKIAGNRLGTRQSPEAIEKTRLKNLGLKRSPETIERMRRANLGKTIPQEQRDKISKSLTGKKMSVESRINKSIALKGKGLGRICSPETRAKISAANKGRVLTQEQKQHLSKLNKGKKRSRATKLKITEHRRKWAKLDKPKVKQIKQMLSRGFSQSSIGEKFNVDRTTVGQIARGVTWSDV